MNDLWVKQQEALANADRKQQVELADKNRKLKWEITLFTEYSRRQSALKEINQRFYTDNFPLYIRMENYCDLVEVGKVRAVKIVFSPLAIDAGNGNNHALNGIDGNTDFDYDAVINVIIALAEISAGTSGFISDGFREFGGALLF